VIISFLQCETKKTENDVNDSKAIVEQNDLPNLPLTFADGEKKNAQDLDGNTIIVLFHPDCDHCQREANQIAAFSESFTKYQVYFISSAPITEIVKFGHDYNLAGKPNFKFAQTGFDDVLKSYGSIDTPSLYIYSADKRLKQAFNGETAMEVIVKYL
jgi:peroxiredoxin